MSRKKKTVAQNNNGVLVKKNYAEPKTKGQKMYVDSILKNKLTVCDGPAGCGKTLLAASAAVKLLREKSEYDHIVIVRPAITACNEKIGFLPGSIDEKMEPFMMPVLYNLSRVVGIEYYNLLMKNDIIKVIPLAYMRGLTLDNCVIIFDEAQNATPEQMKMFLTRLGESCKAIVEGDQEQSDINFTNGLEDIIERLDGVDNVGIISMDRADIMRSKFVSDVLDRYDQSI